MTGPRSSFAALLVGMLLLGACEEDAPQSQEIIRPVRALKVSDAGVLQQRWFPGQAKAVRELDIAFNVAGPLVEFAAKIGDEVEK